MMQATTIETWRECGRAVPLTAFGVEAGYWTCAFAGDVTVHVENHYEGEWTCPRCSHLHELDVRAYFDEMESDR